MQTVTDAELDRYRELQVEAANLARKGETETLALMLDAGMPLNLSDEKGNTLLMLATYNQNYETSKMLLERGADTERRNDRGQTPLGGVAFKGYLDLIELLLEYGAETNADNGGGKTPMLFATCFGRFRARALLKRNGGRMWTKAVA